MEEASEGTLLLMTKSTVPGDFTGPSRGDNQGNQITAFVRAGEN